jgi:UbiD family decarboxylase
MTVRNLGSFLSQLRKDGEVVDITVPCDPNQEIAEIHRRVIEQQGKVLYFHNVKGSSFPLVTNLFGSLNRVEKAFGKEPELFVRDMVRLAHELMPPRLGKIWDARHVLRKGLSIGLRQSRSAPVRECEMSLEPGKGLDALPALVQWPEDGGRFITLPLVYTEDPLTKVHNLGMYRIQLFDEKTTGMHWQIGKGGGFHYSVAEELSQPLPVTLFVGGPPALVLSAVAPLPESVPELMLTSLLLGSKLERLHDPDLPHPLVAEAEFAFVGRVQPRVRRPEGPFGDHYGYYSLQHDYPVFEVERMFHRKGAVFPATVVGKPRQEDFFIGDYLQNLLSPLFPLVMPGVVDLKTYGETGFHALAAARVKDRYAREAIASALRILGEGQLSLQKFLMVTDQAVDLSDFASLLVAILERTSWERDLFVISNVSQDTLDYTGPKVNEGSKAVWLALGSPIRTLSAEIKGALPSSVTRARVFVPGCVVIEGPRYSEEPGFASRLAETAQLEGIELMVLVDDLDFACASVQNFLWMWFTRFEPAADIYGAAQVVRRFHVGLKSPVVFDSRMKPWYPGTVEPDPAVVKQVDQRWASYFRGASPW